MSEFGSSISKKSQRARHEVKGAQLHILVIGQNEDYVWASLTCGVGVPRESLRRMAAFVGMRSLFLAEDIKHKEEEYQAANYKAQTGVTHHRFRWE